MSWRRDLVCLAAWVLLATPGWATEGEHEIAVGLTGGVQAAGLEARWLRDLTDFWALGAAVHNRLAWANLPAAFHAVTVEGRYVLDALQWIPSIGAGLGGGLGSGSGAVRLRPWGHLDVGIDYRPARNWGLGARLGAEAALDSVAAYAVVGGLCWNWYGGQGIGLDL